MVKHGLVALIVCLVMPVVAQQADSQTVERYLERAKEFVKQTPWKSIGPAEEALELAQAQGRTELQAEAHLVLSKAVLAMQQNDEAMMHLVAALELYRKLNNQERVGEALQGIGIVYEQIGEPKLSLQYLQQALNVFQDIGDTKGIARVHVSLGIHYWKENDLPKALLFYEKAMAYQKQLDDPIGYAATLSNIATIHQIQGEYTRAIELYQEVISLKDAHESTRGLAIAYGNMGEAYLKLEKLKEADEALFQSLVLAEGIEALDVIVATLDNMVALRKEQGRLAEALELKEKQGDYNARLIRQQSSEKATAIRNRHEMEEKDEIIRGLKTRLNDKTKAFQNMRTQRTVLLIVTVMLLIAILSMLLIIRSCMNGLPGKNGDRLQAKQLE